MGVILKILYVDDESSNREYFELLYGHIAEIITAESGKKALEIIRANPERISIVISDQRMPQMTGYELHETLKNEHPNILRVLASVYSDIPKAVINEGVVIQRVIAKPWIESEVMEIINANK